MQIKLRALSLLASAALAALFHPAPASAAPGAGTVARDIVYGHAAGETLLLDAHTPGGQGPFPVVLVVHGGGWSGGDKEEDIMPAMSAALTNFTWFTINYRLAPANRWPACYDDVLNAIRWVKQHAPEYKGDPDRIALMGYSSGGHLVALAGTRTNLDTRVRAVVALAPPTDIARDALRRGGMDKWVSMKNLLGRDQLDAATLEVMKQISPINYIQPGMPPFLLVQGDADKTVPCVQTVDFESRLKSDHVPCGLIIIPGGQHRISDWARFEPGWPAQVADWLNRNLTKDQSNASDVSGSATDKSIVVVSSVANDVSANFTNLQSAINAAPDHGTRPYRILLKPGIYEGQFIVPKSKNQIQLFGEDAGNTVLTYGLNVRETNASTDPRFKGAGTVVLGDNFQARNVTIQNTSGDHGQALALRVDGDRAVFNHCRILGWQDTLMLNDGRDYFTNCYLAGRVDFIYGSATAVFQNCEIHSKNGGHVTAANTPRDQPFGFVFLGCQLTGDPNPWIAPDGTPANQRDHPMADLGRPWRPYASVAYINCWMGDHINPAGWNNWRNPANETTARYAEYNSSGPGANPARRVKWARQLTPEQAQAYTVANILHGADGWDPAQPDQIPEANQMAQSANAAAAASSRTLPVLFIVGDSTVHNSAPGLLGWGDVVGRFFDPGKISVENHAKPGRSSRTFQTQGWWARILSAARPGDFVIIQMGHNDGGPLDDASRARGTIPGIGGQSQTIHNPLLDRPEVVHTYGWYMRKYIVDARAHGMIPIICSPVPRVPEHTVKAGDTDKTPWVEWSREVAGQEKAFFIPLNHLILMHYVGMSPHEIKAAWFTTNDNTHANAAGAALNASAVVAGLRALDDCPLKLDLLNP